MRIEIIAKNYNMSDWMKNLIEEKLSKFDKYFDEDAVAKVAAALYAPRAVNAPPAAPTIEPVAREAAKCPSSPISSNVVSSTWNLLNSDKPSESAKSTFFIFVNVSRKDAILPDRTNSFSSPRCCRASPHCSRSVFKRLAA